MLYGVRAVPPRAILSVVIASLLWSSNACISVQTLTTADIVVETARGHDHYTYEAWDSHNISAIAIACVVTATFYGGACWAYLATPFDEHELAAIGAAKREVAALGGCAHLVSARVIGVGWDARSRVSRLSTLRGRALTSDDVQRLCRGTSPVVIEGPAAAVEEPEPVTFDSAPVPVSPKPRLQADPMPFDPADP